MALAFSPDPDILANFSLENYYRGSTSQLMSNIDDELRYSIGGRWRSLSEEYGHPFTLTFGATVGRDFNKPSVGALFTDVVLSKRLSRLDLKLSALYGIYASEKPLGVGLGVSREVLPSFYIGGEITVTNERKKIWQLNAEYDFENTPFRIGLFATNAIGRTGMGQLYSTSEPTIGAALRWETNLNLF